MTIESTCAPATPIHGGYEWASRTPSYSLRASRYSNFLKQFIRLAMPEHKLEPTIDTTVL